MRKIFIVLAVAVGLLAVSCDDDYTPSATLQDLFNTQYPNAVDVDWERERKGYRVVEFRLNGQECEAYYKNGKWVLTEYSIRYSELPAAVSSAFESSWGTATPIDSIYRVERNTTQNEVVYVIEIQEAQQYGVADVYLYYATDGELLRKWIELENVDYIDYYL